MDSNNYDGYDEADAGPDEEASIHIKSDDSNYKFNFMQANNIEIRVISCHNMGLLTMQMLSEFPKIGVCNSM